MIEDEREIVEIGEAKIEKRKNNRTIRRRAMDIWWN